MEGAAQKEKLPDLNEVPASPIFIRFANRRNVCSVNPQHCSGVIEKLYEPKEELVESVIV